LEKIFLLGIETKKRYFAPQSKPYMRYLLPLNNDGPFKAVFSDPEIAKPFLEAILGVQMTEIELLPTDHKVTNAASIVRFDFRCKIDGQYVIIEMQKVTYNYLIKRFYLYHCLSVALQLEYIQDKIEILPDGREKITKRYEQLLPTITLDWIALDDFGLRDDFIDFRMYPHELLEFLTEDSFWRGDKETLLEMRQKMLKKWKVIESNFGFHAENRLIYLFQKNVVQNASNKPYTRWFEFAQKTLDPNNTEADFKPYVHDLIFSKMIQRLSTQSMPPAELRAMIGEEAYAAALRGKEESDELERKFKIKKDFYDLYGSEIYDREAAAAWKLTMAHQEFGKIEQSLLKEAQQKEAARLKAEQEKVKAEQEKVKAEKLAAEQKELLQKEKEAKKLLLKAERDKAKVQQKLLLKAEKEKQVLLLKAEKEKNQLKMLELGKKMLENGQDITFICNLLSISEAALRG
jgi:hypothetical protein